MPVAKSGSIKIALVDDHEMFRSGIKLILSQKPEWEIIIEAANGSDFLDQLKHIQPDVVLMDISMPKMDGYTTSKAALKEFPEIKIIALSMLSDEAYYYKMIEAGVNGFVLKNSGIDELLRAIEEVAQGNNYFAQDLLRKIVLSINNKVIDNKLKLSEREIEVLGLICNGNTNKEIAEKIFLSVKSIEKYRTCLLQKTGTRNSAHLVMYAILNKLIEF
jgi:DNA-binding NarL/FixJ family response regulator